MKSGVKLIADTPGAGAAVERGRTYLVRLKMWLNKGESIRWERPWGMVDRARLEDDGATLVSDLRVDRESMVNGLFYGVDGMHVGGTRKLRISPHLAYGERGVPGTVPKDAVLVMEIEFIEERVFR